MLAALKALDENKARRVLSRASEQLMPARFLQGARIEVSSEEQQLAQAVLDEVSKQATATGYFEGERKRGKMLDLLSQQITAFVFSTVDEKEVRKRLGGEGKLPVSNYAISFSPKFEAGARFWGLSKQHVENAIRNNDFAEHLTTILEGSSAQPHESLFTQNPPVKKDPYTIIVRAQRLGDVLLVEEAYRIYHSDVNLIGASSPREILGRFLDQFGTDVEIEVTGRDPTITRGKLFDRFIVHIPDGEEVIVRMDGEIANRLKRQAITADADDRIELSITFGVRDQAYIDQLKRHGVAVESPQQSLRGFTLRGVSPQSP